MTDQPNRFYGEPVTRFKAMQNGTGECDGAHFKVWCGIAAEEIEYLRDLLTSALPYVEEGEEFNKPNSRTLSKKIRKEITQ